MKFVVTEKLPGRVGRKNGVLRVRAFVCQKCGEEFVSHNHDRKFCSRKCYWAAKKGTKVVQNIPEEVRRQRRERMMGENNPMWCGGDSDRERRNSAYKAWRLAVFERDDYTCQSCGHRNGKGVEKRKIQAHHIVQWIESVELRYEVDNGITMCVPCHIKEHAKVGKHKRAKA